jgi:ribosomal protein S7
MKLKHLNYFDCVYNSLIISKIINVLVSKGKKYIQEKLLYQSFFLLTVNSKESAYLILFEILEFLRPNIYVEFKSKKVLKKNILTIVPKKLDYYQQLNQSIK